MAARRFPLSITRHRPWPLPDGPWLMAQRWHDLLFAHWPCDPTAIRPLLPRGLRLDEQNGAAWVGIVPFEVRGLRLRGLPPMPMVHAFPELNVRTYVTCHHKPGVWFFSLDADSTLAVIGARVGFHLPYFAASMSIARERRGVHYTSVRRGRRRPRFDATYAPVGPIFNAVPGSLEYFLTERYCLYTADRHGALIRAEIHHPPWMLQPARMTLAVESMAAAAGVRLPVTPPILHFARRQDVRIWAPSRVRLRARRIDVDVRQPVP